MYPKDFEAFYKAMSAKMEKKKKAYGDSWKNDYLAGTDTPMATFLVDRLEGELREYFESGDEKELVDVANCCAMLWCRAQYQINVDDSTKKGEP